MPSTIPSTSDTSIERMEEEGRSSSRRPSPITPVPAMMLPQPWNLPHWPIAMYTKTFEGSWLRALTCDDNRSMTCRMSMSMSMTSSS
jgi:hypothetical protein